MVDEVRVTRELATVDHLVLVSEIHIHMLIEGSVDPEEEAVLVNPGARPFARTGTDRIEIDQYFIECDKRPFRSGWNRNIHTKHLTEANRSPIGMLDPAFFSAFSCYFERQSF